MILRSAHGGGERVIRAPNHLGDVVMALPAMAADGGDVLVVRWLAPLLGMAGLAGRVIPFDRGFRGWRIAVSELRAAGYRKGTLLTPSFSAAWLCRWGGLRELRGTATDGRGWLLPDPVPTEALVGRHRINQFRLLLEQDSEGIACNHPLAPRREDVAMWRKRLGDASSQIVGLFPGSNAPARRWPPDRFTAVGRALAGQGARIVVMGGAAERELTARTSEGIPQAVDTGGATDLIGLAALLKACDLVITNDTGPMHLAGAVGTPTVTLWGPSDPAEVCPVGARDVRISGACLPCRPCFKNVCPRSGAGTSLPEAHEECMQLISVNEVVETAVEILGGGPS
jgi:ADP-heptose:LPS heptosyltransferase